MAITRATNHLTVSHHLSRFIAAVVFTALTLTLYIAPAAAEIQLESCGTVVPPEQVARALEVEAETAAKAYSADKDVFVDIPVAYHIIRQSNGTGGFSTFDLNASHDSANVLFAQLDVAIYQYSVDYIDDDDFYFGTDTQFMIDSLRRVNVVPEAVNIYFVPSISGFPYCGLSSFTFSGTQGIVMNNACAGATIINSTLVHEIGHYFNLYHTHETAFGDECPDGSNCSSAGDLICDTPADPTLSSTTVDETCTYVGGEISPASCGNEPYAPQVENIMSYSRKSCRDYQTPQQNDKFRTTLLTMRPELASSVGGLLALPGGIDDLPAVAGSTGDSTIMITNTSTTPFDITGYTTATGIVSVSGSTPVTVNQNDSVYFTVTFDATALTDECDLGPRYDTVTFATTNANVPTVTIPISPNVVYAVPTAQHTTLGANCLIFTVPNTPGFSDGTGNGFVAAGLGNIVYDGSLVIALVDGVDTVAYRDLYSANDFTVVDAYAAGVDAAGRQTRTIRFITNDNRFHGAVSYHYGYNSLGIDSCHAVEIDYTITNPCDTALTFVAGFFSDFDIDDSGDNDAYVDDDIVIATDPFAGVNQSAGLSVLHSCGANPTLRTISNPALIYPTNGLTAADAYREMTSPASVGTLAGTDVSALISFGEVTVEPGGEAFFQMAIFHSDTGPDDLKFYRDDVDELAQAVFADADNDCIADAVDNCPNTYNPDQLDANNNNIGDVCEYICGDANGDQAVNVGDAVFIINYVFNSGSAPDPLAAADPNCDGAINLGDAVYIINYIFKSGSAPCANCM